MKLKNISKTFEPDLQDPEFVRIYLEEALHEGGQIFLMALRNVVQANEDIARSVSELPKRTADLDYDNPQFGSVERTLKALGLRLSIEPEPTAQAS
jgi:DNA-binding phage protein